ncbi:fibronectin type III domain-containing protein [Aquisphaera giovannonii]|nr:fibronectin type III domain-containing protein [Aquisphaera giovannonii]
MVPDYYARLGVDPAATESELEAALRKRQPAWSMGTRNPKTRHTNQLYLDEVPALRRALLSGPGARAAYDADLAAARLAEREEKLDQLQRRIRLKSAKGGLSADDRQLLREEARRLGLDDAVVDPLTRSIPDLARPFRAEDALEEDEAAADVLDPSTRRQIRAALEHLGRRDLYDALELPREAPSSILAARADEERQRWMRKAQVTAEKTAWLEVISHAQSHLTSPKARARYDRTLILESEERFDEVVAFALNGLPRLDGGTRAALVAEAAALCLGPDRAERLLSRACRKLGVARDDGAVSPLVASPGPPATASEADRYPQVRCRSCSGLTELSPTARRTGTARCRHCGASLRWDCPACRRQHWLDRARCDCGFPLALREPLVRRLAAAQQAFRDRDLATARENLEQVRRYAPQHPGARNGLEKIREREATIEQVRLACELAMTGRRLVAARRAADSWRRIDDPARPEIRAAWEEIASGLRKAESLAARGRALERVDPPAARAFYRRSLEAAADLPAALTGLERCPPEGPTNLRAQTVGDRVRLSWTPPAPDGGGPLTFAILRKRGGIPEHPGDGTRIAEVSTCEYDDRHVRPGESVGYAVLGKRGEAESLAAVAVGPVVYLPDVEDVRVEPRESEVELSWIPPAGVFEVRVVRKAGSPPEDPRDGERVPAALDHAIDGRPPGGQVVHYGIYAIYRAAEGRRYPSPGVLATAGVVQAVPPAEAPRLSRGPGPSIRIDWAAPARGSVRILRTSRPLPFPPGARIRVEEAEPLGSWVPAVGPASAEDREPPPAPVCYYTAVVALGAMLTIGGTAAASQVPDPSDLRATRTGTTAYNGGQGVRVALRWRWPPGATATRLVARWGSPPHGPDDPQPTATTVRREDYERHGFWSLTLPAAGPRDEDSGNGLARPHGGNGIADGDGHAAGPEAGASPALPDRWYITAFTAVDQGGETVFSPGIEPSATTAVPGPHPEITVSYALKRSWLPGRPWSLTLDTDPPGEEVPPMVLVANLRAIPLSSEDGEVIAHLPAGRGGSRHPVHTTFPLARSGVRMFIDPRADPAFIPPIRLRHPEDGTARA